MRRPIEYMAALVALSAWLLAGCALATPSAAVTRKSIAHNGGVRITVQVECLTGQDCAFTSAFAQTMSALQQRARVGLGVPDASVKRLDGTRIAVDLPGYTNQQVAEQALTTQGSVTFIDTGDVPVAVGTTVSAGQYPVLFTSLQIDPSSVSAQLEQQTGQPIVTFAFKGAVASQFAQYTAAHIGGYLTITLDNTVIESAMIVSQISGEGEITGSKTLADAQALAADLKTTPLSAPVTLVSATVMKASGG